MTALYIIGGIAAVIALILLMYVKLYISFTADCFELCVRLGPVKIPLSEKKKINFKKTARRLKGKKLSDISSKKKKTSKTSKKGKDKTKKQKSVFGELKDIVFDADSEGGKKELLCKLLDFIKAVARKFMSKVRFDIKSLKVGVDTGDPHTSAIVCGVLWQSVAAALETVGAYAADIKIRPDAVSIAPVFNDGKFIYDISVKIKIRIGSVIGAALSSFITFIKIYLMDKARKDMSISKQTNMEKRKERKEEQK